MSRQLAIRPSSPLATAGDQCARLGKVLTSYSSWSRAVSLDKTKLAEAKSVLIAVREVKDTAEKGRKTLTAPLLAQKKEIDGIYRRITETAEALDSHLVSLLLDLETRERSILIKAAEKEAKAAEKKGNEQLAADLRQQAERSAVIASGDGITTRAVQRAAVTDLKALCLAIGKGEAPVELVEPRMSALNALVKAGLQLPPGVEITIDTVIQRAS